VVSEVGSRIQKWTPKTERGRIQLNPLEQRLIGRIRDRRPASRSSRPDPQFATARHPATTKLAAVVHPPLLGTQQINSVPHPGTPQQSSQHIRRQAYQSQGRQISPVAVPASITQAIKELEILIKQ
jgi:hypothetical protein